MMSQRGFEGKLTACCATPPALRNSELGSFDWRLPGEFFQICSIVEQLFKIYDTGCQKPGSQWVNNISFNEGTFISPDWLSTFTMFGAGSQKIYLIPQHPGPPPEVWCLDRKKNTHTKQTPNLRCLGIWIHWKNQYHCPGVGTFQIFHDETMSYPHIKSTWRVNTKIEASKCYQIGWYGWCSTSAC